MATVLLCDGRSRILADLTTPLGLQLYRYGMREAELEYLRRRLAPGDVFVDGGANVGIFTLLAANVVGERGKVIACEPARETMALLEANVRLNGYGCVDLHRAALGEESGEATLFSFGPGAGVSSFAPSTYAGSRPERVRVTTLDALTANCISRVRLIKLDIEGSEVLALRGAVELLKGPRPDFIVEVDPDHLSRQQTSLEDLERIFHEAGYIAYSISHSNSGLTVAPVPSPWRTAGGSPNLVLRPRPTP